MRLLDNIVLIDLAIYTNNTLILTDFHIGYEESLNKKGIMVPRFQFPEILKRLDSIFKKLANKKIEKVIVNGDLKHEFGTISGQEWRHTLRLLDYLGQHCNDIILIKGNHDRILGPIAKKKDVKILDYFIIETEKNTMGENSINGNQSKKINKKNNDKIKKIKANILQSLKKTNPAKKTIKNKILVIHGDKIPPKSLLEGVSTIIIGHEHPAVSIKEGPRAELFKAYLIGKWKGKNLIVQPSFKLVNEGTDVLKEELLSPFLKQNLGNFDVVVVGDKLYRFGKIKDL